MSPHKTKQPEKKESQRVIRRRNEQAAINTIETKLANPEAFVDSKYFNDLPLSDRTKDGLKKAGFTQLTEIQRKALPLALAKRDVLGAAKTGSGKTLSFLIPVLDILYRSHWNASDGLGALIISPTRELAVQIFEVLKKIGRTHTFSAGLIIGGKELQVEQERIAHMNILVATPGRLLQHMDQTVGFNCDNLQVLVLDEADRIMDMGFQRTINAVIENLPKQRQTLLFSATQTRSVKDLARLSLKDPEYVAVHEQAEHSTPQKLTQHYVVCELQDKLDILYSFIKTHLKSKVIVFLSSCKQTRFVYETFCKLQPGIPIIHLHGKQKQTKRVDIFRQFTHKQHAILFCTDIAARGLDFPAVDWVVQLDCPEDADTYIHRAGRTARFDAEGHALLMLVPTEKDGMLEELKNKKVPIEEIKIKSNKQQSIRTQLQSFCFQDPEIKYLGQRAFVAYMRSVYLQRKKNIFKVTELPADEFAHSLGLAGTPKIKFVKKAEKSVGPLKAAPAKSATDDEDDEDEEEEKETQKAKTKYDRMFQKRNQDILSEHYTKLVDYEGDKLGGDDDDDDFMTIGRKDHALDSDSDDNMKDTKADNLSKRQAKMGKKELAKRSSKGEKLVFDDEGKPHQLYEMVDEADFLKDGDAKAQKDAFISETGELMKMADVDDKALAKQKRADKKYKRKMKEKEAREQGAEYDSDEQDEYSQDDDEMDQDSLSSSDDDEQDKPTQKRKWFQKSSDDEQDDDSSPKKRVLQVDQPETIQDQEALALKLLGAL
ncbi:P-loop containing nucleoside triphosphate hydrolase protein [Chlamydoabsidia padenii]|nr:P-loop containing nucleoside triphosphate hydrolase protein [Chlamydoabsidia padenii]